MSGKLNISRRDFLNGVALSLAAGTTLSPVEILAMQGEAGGGYYPPGLTGMRGSHAGSFEIAHAVARAGATFPAPASQTDNDYDLIVVGGGISGLSAAKLYRDRLGQRAKILILDNHDDFGGHAKRNELDVDGKKLLGYGGSQTIEGPAKYSKVARQLLQDVSIDVQRFYEYYDQEYFNSRNLGRGIYFDKSTYGVDRVLANPLGGLFGDQLTPGETREAVAAMPISDTAKVDLVRLLSSRVDYLDGMSVAEKRELLRGISYLDFLKKYAGMSAEVTGILQDSYLPLIAVGWEAGQALWAARSWFPGTQELGVQEDRGEREPYIFHFPDGNAGVARSLVRNLLPEALPGSTMEDLVTARANYSLLDTADSDVRIRLNSTAVGVAHTADGKNVDVTYVSDGATHRVRGKHVVLACYNGIIPHICNELPERQVEAIQYATKIPFVIGNIAIRNWRAISETGFSEFYSPGDVFFKWLPMDFPVSMGDYQYSQGPDDPVVLSGWYSPTTRGLMAKEQFRAGRHRMLEMTYDDFEKDIYAHLDGMLGPYGFDVEKEIAAITLNRWSHGYAYEYESIGEPAEYGRYNGPHIAGRAQIGRISIANADSEAYAYVNGAIDAADRAVNEQLDKT